METAVFWVVAGFTMASALVTALSGNVIRSAFALLGALAGVAGIFGMAGADLLAVVQVLIYVGGIMVLILFAVMLTHRIRDVKVSNRSLHPLPAALVSGALLIMLVVAITRAFPADTMRSEAPMAPRVGAALLGTYAVPFATSAFVLLSALVGAVVLSRKDQQGKGGGL